MKTVIMLAMSEDINKLNVKNQHPKTEGKNFKRGSRLPFYSKIKEVKKLEKLGIKKIAFLQAIGLAIYISLVGTFMYNGNRWFPVNNFLGPIFVLTLLSVSVLVCGFLSMGYPIYLFWEKKQRLEAMKLVGLTTKWLILFLISVLMLAVIFK